MNQRFVNPQSGGDQRENINKIGRGCFYMETPEFSDIAQEQKKKGWKLFTSKIFWYRSENQFWASKRKENGNIG